MGTHLIVIGCKQPSALPSMNACASVRERQSHRNRSIHARLRQLALRKIPGLIRRRGSQACPKAAADGGLKTLVLY